MSNIQRGTTLFNLPYDENETLFNLPYNDGEVLDIELVTPIAKDGTTNYEKLSNIPSINGVPLIGNKTTEELLIEEGGTAEFPAGGNIGDLLAKRSNADNDVEWITPAQSVEQDNTRPITAAAVYTEIGNINALLAII